MSQAWWLTPNEKRMAMNYGEEENSDILNDYYIPANLIPVKDNDVSDMEMDNEIDVEKLLKSKVPGMTDVFTTRREAEARARELGGSGSHAHTFDGREVYAF